MNRFLSTSLFLAAAATASAVPTSSVVQTNNYSLTGSADVKSLVFQQFNSNLGTLTGIEISSTGTLTGSFVVTKSGPGSVSVVNSSAQMYLTFTQSGPDLATTTLIPIPTTPDSGVTGTSFTSAGSPKTFTVTSAQTLTLDTTSLFNSWSAWFTGTGSRTVDVQDGFGVTVTGSNFSTDFANMLQSGSVTLTYYYTAAPVPEASTYGIALGGLALAGAIIRRRRSAK